jgi:ADP-ribose pyrophosphatase YjhB (NUDIX family)/nicotinamide mononucleotide adenylyltransferase
MKTYGAVVGRFQLDYPTEGHRALLDEVCDRHENRLIIVLGCSRSPANATNPLSYEARVVMLKRLYPHAIFVKQSDERYDEVWSQKLDRALDAAASDNEVVLYTGRDGFAPHYKGKNKVIELPSIFESSATTVREDITRWPRWESGDFRRGVIYAMNTKHFQTYNTVDMALLHNTGSDVEILLCRKPNETAWRFPGGFIEEAKNETYAEAAAREMQEETGCVSETGWKIIRDYPIPDEWRLRKNKGVSHRTILLYGWSASKYAKADDDIAEVKWFSLNEVAENVDTIMVSEHRQLMFNDVFDQIGKNAQYQFTSPRDFNA